MRTLGLISAVTGALLLIAPAASAQNDQGWRGTLDQLNRAVNPDNSQSDRRDRYDDRNTDNRRYEGSSGREDRGDSSEFRRLSDGDIRDRLDRVNDEQRQLQRERRALEDEMSRRGMRR
ncbi:hypothetical protein [Azospirillum sp.]|uniref:hypothetical protein n=1 Tax=Azospirillum sp. TaxID=34012 RepID=UPI003D74077E